MKKLFITFFCFIIFLHTECKAECVTSLYNIQQSLFTYIYLIRQDPVHFNSYVENMNDALKILRDIDKAISIVPDTVKPIDFKTRLSFNEYLYILQRGQQYAMIRGGNKIDQLKSSAFIISNYPPLKNKVLLILSATSPVQLIIVSFDQCLNVKVLFDSMSPDFSMYRNDISRPQPLWKVVLTEDDIELYEYDRIKPYSFNNLVGR
ncbi:TPA: hypothetical protein N2F65_003624 [Salmonella enterica]|nr:hypothetical protein [Salmonella enterica subsp. enterica serovar Abony]EEF3597375.1 hypothetical protein [Salmonella enterica subsp. enterica serovar Abony]HCL5221498.1 hypothetical protein [Salmonella enterica]